MKVFVYYNLRKKVWSLKAADGRLKGLVIGHAERVRLHDATFKVSLAGNARVRREGRKNVHAGVEGRLVGVAGWVPAYDNLQIDVCPYHIEAMEGWLREYGERVTYNPYKHTTFVTRENEEPVYYRNSVTMNATRSIPVVRGGN